MRNDFDLSYFERLSKSYLSRRAVPAPLHRNLSPPPQELAKSFGITYDSPIRTSSRARKRMISTVDFKEEVVRQWMKVYFLTNTTGHECQQFVTILCHWSRQWPCPVACNVTLLERTTPRHSSSSTSIATMRSTTPLLIITLWSLAAVVSAWSSFLLPSSSLSRSLQSSSVDAADGARCGRIVGVTNVAGCGRRAPLQSW